MKNVEDLIKELDIKVGMKVIPGKNTLKYIKDWEENFIKALKDDALVIGIEEGQLEFPSGYVCILNKNINIMQYVLCTQFIEGGFLLIDELKFSRYRAIRDEE